MLYHIQQENLSIVVAEANIHHVRTLIATKIVSEFIMDDTTYEYKNLEASFKERVMGSYSWGVTSW